MPSDVGVRVRMARERAGITARELARLAGLSNGLPSLIESGERKEPSGTTIQKIASVLGVTTDWLIRGAGREPSARQLKAAVEKARAA